MMLFRKIEREKFISLLKVLIMGIGVASALVLFYIAISEFNTDNFYKDKDRTYQCFVDYKSPDWNFTGTHLMQPFIPALVDYFPEVEVGTVIFHNEDLNFEYNDNIIKANTLYADSFYFKVFNRKILARKSNDFLSHVNKAVVTKEFALKYFGDNESAVSKVIKLNGVRPIEITAVIENWPANSSQSSDVIISFETLKDEKRLYMGWGGGDSFQGYIKINKNTSAERIEKEIPNFITKYVDVKAEEAKGMFTKYLLIPITKADVTEKPVKKVILLIMIFIGVLIMGLVFFNTLLINLSASDKFHRTTSILRILGATNSDLQKNALLESLFFLIITAIVAYVFAWILNPLISVIFGYSFFELLLNPSYLWVAILSFLSIFLVNYLVQMFWISGFFSAKKTLVSRRKNNRFQKALLTLQIGISFSLLIFLYFIHAQLSFASSFDKGYNSDNLIYIELNNEPLYKNHTTIKDEIKNLKNVESVCLSNGVITQGLSGNGFYIDPAQENLKIFRQLAVDEDFFTTIGMNLQGKAFLPTEDKMSIIVNEEVGKIMNNPNPVGHYLYRGGAREIKAVVPDFIAGSIQSKMQPTVFVKYTEPSVYSTLSIRLSKNNQKEAIEEIEAAISRIVPDQYIQIRFYNADIDENYKFDRTVEKTISFFTLLAILITISGLVGFSINMVKKRSKEIGIRKVSGASSLSILLLLNRHFILNTLIALLLFIPLSYLLVVIWLENYAYAVNISPFVFIVASVLLILIVLIIVSLASLRYAQIDPVKTIRYE